jgi:hypothetical protein
MEVKKTKELHIGEYNSIMEIFRYNPVTYCLKCKAKKYSSYCKCNRLPRKIGNARVIDIEFVKFKKNLTREEHGSREESQRREKQGQHYQSRPRKGKKNR